MTIRERNNARSLRAGRRQNRRTICVRAFGLLLPALWIGLLTASTSPQSTVVAQGTADHATANHESEALDIASKVEESDAFLFPDDRLQALADLSTLIETHEVEIQNHIDQYRAGHGSQTPRIQGLDQDAQGTWQSIPVEGATCGQGAPFNFYLNAAANQGPETGIVFMLDGGGACLKEGPAPEGAEGIAAQLHCMNFTNFEDPFFTDQIFNLGAALVPAAFPIFDRSDADNPFRDYHFVAVPYCTGDVFAGRMTEPHDYDPSPDGEFLVTHRGHLNFLAVVEHLYGLQPADVPVILTGMSAGGFGAIYNFPSVLERWPNTILVPDSGIAPPSETSLLARERETVITRWGADALLPDYCNSPACQSSSLTLLQAHAKAYGGLASPSGRWLPFGYIQSQQDEVLVDYLETDGCGYQMGLRSGRGGAQPDNLRAFIPQTTKHVFHISIELPSTLQEILALILGGAEADPFVSERGVNVIEWFTEVASAKSNAELPEEAIDPWLRCNEIMIPLGMRDGTF